MRVTRPAQTRSRELGNPTDLSIETLAARLREVEQCARELGIFTADRELLSCASCGLLEDVLADGRLITCRRDTHGRDAGLRFIETANPDCWVCPSCGAAVPLEADEPIA